MTPPKSPGASANRGDDCSTHAAGTAGTSSGWPAIAGWAACAGVIVAGVVACSGDSNTKGGAQAPSGARSVSIDHERCDDSGANVESLDTNGDGRPDIRRVFDRAPSESGAHEMCRVVDLNHDGRPDLYEYFDASGTIRRREYCYDDTGVVNAIEVYRGGRLVERQYDTTGQHKIDTWDWFDPDAPVDAKTGRPVHPLRRERDIHGDGYVGQWWTWNGDAVSIATDRNGDGKPDPDSFIVLGADAGASSTGASPAAAPPAEADAGASATPAAESSAATSGAKADGGVR